MAIKPTGIETLEAPETGVYFFKALECLDSFTLKLIENYPRICVETEAVKGLAESQPFFHEEYKERNDMEVVDLYINDKQGDNGDVRLQQEMSWRHRSREESARTRDAGDAIKKSIFGGQIIRTFDSDKTKDISNGFMTRLIGLCGEGLHEIGDKKYGKIKFVNVSGRQISLFARLDENDRSTVFGSTLTLAEEDLKYVREADADDCCQLVEDLISPENLSMLIERRKQIPTIQGKLF